MTKPEFIKYYCVLNLVLNSIVMSHIFVTYFTLYILEIAPPI